MLKRFLLAMWFAGPTLDIACAPTASWAQSALQAPLKAGTYAVDPDRSRIEFALLRFGFPYYSGTFAGPSGTLRLDPTKPTATALQVTVPIESLATGNSAVDSDLKGPGWFDAAAYPTATFTSTKVVATGPDKVEITGTLTLHGVTQTEMLTARYLSAGMNPLTQDFEVGFEAATTIRRSDFGLTALRPIVGDDVRLTITGVFVARP